MTRFVPLVFAVLVAVAAAQARSPNVDISGTWEAETPDGPRKIVVRPDSSASFGEETVRWRVQDDSLHIAFGDEWTVYGFLLEGKVLTITGGDLEEPVELERVGPPSPRPEGVEIPPAPPADQRSIGL